MPRKPLADADLVLVAPQHYHVGVIAYEREDPETKQFLWSTHLELVANDVSLAVDRAKRIAVRPNAHIQDVRQCAEAAHLA